MDGARERWARLVGRWRRSGRTAREFAEAAGINASTLTHWAWRLKREGGGERRGRAARRDSPAPVRQGGFVEMLAGPLAERRFEIELVDGRRLRVPCEFDAAVLERLLGVLASTAR